MAAHVWWFIAITLSVGLSIILGLVFSRETTRRGRLSIRMLTAIAIALLILLATSPFWICTYAAIRYVHGDGRVGTC